MAGGDGGEETGAGVNPPSGARGLDRFDARVAHPARVYDYWLGGRFL